MSRPCPTRNKPAQGGGPAPPLVKSVRAGHDRDLPGPSRRRGHARGARSLPGNLDQETRVVGRPLPRLRRIPCPMDDGSRAARRSFLRRSAPRGSGVQALRPESGVQAVRPVDRVATGEATAKDDRLDAQARGLAWRQRGRIGRPDGEIGQLADLEAADGVGRGKPAGDLPGWTHACAVSARATASRRPSLEGMRARPVRA